MHRRELLARIPIVLFGFSVIRCAAEDPYPPEPGGQGGGGGGGTDDDEITSFRVENNDGSGHSHWFEVQCTQLQSGQTTWTAQGAHTHTIVITDDQLADIVDGRTVTVETTGGHPHTWILTMPQNMRC